MMGEETRDQLDGCPLFRALAVPGMDRVSFRSLVCVRELVADDLGDTEVLC